MVEAVAKSASERERYGQCPPAPSGTRLPPRSSNHSYVSGSGAPAGVSASVEPDPSSRIAAPAGPVHSADAGTARLARGGRFWAAKTSLVSPE